MKSPVFLTVMSAIILFLVAGCGIFNPDDRVNIKIELDSQILSDQGSITARILNPSSERILVYGETLHSNVQRLNDSGIWVRLVTQPVIVGKPIAWMDWYEHLPPGEVHTKEVSYQSLVNLIDSTNGSGDGESSREPFTIQGEYRFIFELVFNEENDKKNKFYSKSFTVK
jgi:hypothetical protein